MLACVGAVSKPATAGCGAGMSYGKEDFMWENLTIALCLLGFVAALALMLVELPVVVAQAQQALHRRTRPTPRHPAHAPRDLDRTW